MRHTSAGVFKLFHVKDPQIWLPLFKKKKEKRKKLFTINSWIDYIISPEDILILWKHVVFKLSYNMHIATHTHTHTHFFFFSGVDLCIKITVLSPEIIARPTLNELQMKLSSHQQQGQETNRIVFCFLNNFNILTFSSQVFSSTWLTFLIK